MSPELAMQLAEWHQAAFAPQRGWRAEEITTLLARTSARLVVCEKGFALADLTGDEAELLTICIAPAAQGQGKGQRLLTMLHEGLATEGAAKVTLEVAVDNHAAQALYARLGYRQIGRRKAYYRRGEGAVDALIWACSLNGLTL